MRRIGLMVGVLTALAAIAAMLHLPHRTETGGSARYGSWYDSLGI